MKKIIFIFFWVFLNLFVTKMILANERSALEITDDDLVIGDKNAPITIIEYASMSCSHCANFHK